LGTIRTVICANIESVELIAEKKVLLTALQWLVGQELARSRQAQPGREDTLRNAASLLELGNADPEMAMRDLAVEAASSLPEFNRIIAVVLLGRYTFEGRQPPPVRIGEKRKWLARHFELPPSDHDPKVFAKRYEQKTLDMLTEKMLEMRIGPARSVRPWQSTSSDSEPSRQNLPVYQTSFVGRTVELQEIGESLDRSRLVTLTGAGGAGKTRLAVQAAAKLLDGPSEEVWFVELSHMTDPDLVPSAVASVLKVAAAPACPLTTTVVDSVSDRSLVLVLDNCEHLVDACAKLVDSLLRSCPRVRVLATSREPLAIGGELVYRVPSLGLPPAETSSETELIRFDGIRLFLDRADLYHSAFVLTEVTGPTIVSICRQLDGMPLAIELAAARLRSISINDLDQRLERSLGLLRTNLRDVPPRHQTLLATIDWSYRLLSAPEQRVLERLSVFSGTFDLDSAEAVAMADDLTEFDVADLITSLCDKSLLAVETTRGIRYHLLEAIGRYAGEKLDANSADKTATAHRHADRYLAISKLAAPQLSGPHQTIWLEHLDADCANLHNAMAYLILSCRTEDSLEMAWALRRFWIRRGHFAEALGLVRAAIQASDPEALPVLRARVSFVAGSLIEHYGERPDDAKSYLDEALLVARRVEDLGLAAEILSEMAWISFRQADGDGGAAKLDEAVVLARKSGDLHLSARLLQNKAAFLAGIGMTQGGKAVVSEALSYFIQAESPDCIGAALSHLGMFELEEGNPEAARAYFEEASTILTELGDWRSVEVLLENLATTYLLLGDHDQAFDAAVRCVTLGRRTGSRYLPYGVLIAAVCNSALRHSEKAAQLHGAADAMLEGSGEVFERFEQELRVRDQNELRKVMGEDSFSRIYERGRRTTRSRAIELVLEDAAHPAGERRVRSPTVAT
jgi:predicted ATPase